MSEPDRISSEIWERGWGLDPAKYLLDPGQVLAPGKHSAGQLAHARPYISNGSDFFVFPVGAEGFRSQSQAQLGLHRYIGDNAVDGVVIHREESRIVLTGTFPGITSQDNMVECRNILRSIPHGPGIILWAPGVFEREQFVLAENWDFNHDADDRTHSIDYTITLVRIGGGHKVKDPTGRIPPPQPGTKSQPRGKPQRIFTVKAGVRTLRAISKVVYGTQDKWGNLVALNQGQMNAWKKQFPNLGAYQLPTYRWPIGTKFRY
jgi:hypothetical protein